MNDKYDEQVRLLAAALYDIRVLLSSRVGAKDKTPETEAASIAYALHNQALAILGGKTYDVDQAYRALSTFVDARLDTDATRRLRFYIEHADRAQAPR